MHTDLVTVAPEDLVSTAQQRMRHHHVRHLPVVNSVQQLVGIITDRDIRQAAASDAPQMGEHELLYLLDKMTVQSMMTRQVITVRAETSLAAAGQLLLDKKFGCLPVLGEAQQLVGILTVTDVLQAYVKIPVDHSSAFQQGEHPGHVRDMMQKDVVTVPSTMSLAHVQRCMREKHIRHIPVMDDQRLVGMVTDRDLRAATPSPATTLSRGEIAYRMDTTPVATCMTHTAVCVGADEDMVHAARLLLLHKFGCVPVLAEGELVGVVTEMECLRAFLATEQ
jgi:acetoin utilization protein AcuB